MGQLLTAIYHKERKNTLLSGRGSYIKLAPFLKNSNTKKWNCILKPFSHQRLAQFIWFNFLLLIKDTPARSWNKLAPSFNPLFAPSPPPPSFWGPWNMYSSHFETLLRLLPPFRYFQWKNYDRLAAAFLANFGSLETPARKKVLIDRKKLKLQLEFEAEDVDDVTRFSAQHYNYSALVVTATSRSNSCLSISYELYGAKSLAFSWCFFPWVNMSFIARARWLSIRLIVLCSIMSGLSPLALTDSTCQIISLCLASVPVLSLKLSKLSC